VVPFTSGQHYKSANPGEKFEQEKSALPQLQQGGIASVNELKSGKVEGHNGFFGRNTEESVPLEVLRGKTHRGRERPLGDRVAER